MSCYAVLRLFSLRHVQCAVCLLPRPALRSVHPLMACFALLRTPAGQLRGPRPPPVACEVVSFVLLVVHLQPNSQGAFLISALLALRYKSLLLFRNSGFVFSAC